MSRLFFQLTGLLVATSGLLAAGQPQAGPIVPPARPRPQTNVFTTIQGNALDSNNGQLPNVVVRLRDARFGRIVDTELTDRAGLFDFRAIDPGTYVVELMGNDDSVLAASELLNVNAGDAVSAIVKLPFRVQPYSGVMGRGLTASAAAITLQAAALGITAVAATDPVSPVQ